jgi:hypothetical protein
MPKPLRDLIFVHSPLVGPSSWLPTVEVLRKRGAHCHLPTPVDPLTPWRGWVAQLLAALPPVATPILLGHSAAGFLLPALAAALDAAGLVFVDARVPPPQGRTRPVDGTFLEFVKTLPIEGGRLPPWSQWWPDSAIEARIPDPALRTRFAAELPRLPLTWFDDSADVPAWDTRPCGYLQLSRLFEPEALAAVNRGWPVVHVDGTHLHAVFEPTESADAILALIDAMKLTENGHG